MKATLLEKSKDGMTVRFKVEGINAATANALRRSVMEEVPTMAIEDVEIRKNSTVLYDEMVAHRLGLVPLVTDLKSYEMPGDYVHTEDLSAKQKVVFTLKTRAAGYVYSEQLETSDKSVKPAYPRLPIAKLLKGQAIELEATAILGKGKHHTKWAPGHIHYYPEPVITVKKELIEEHKDKYPPQILDNKDNVDTDRINTPELIDACEGVSDAIVVERKDDSFVFTLESWGQLEPSTIIAEAIAQVQGQAKEVAGLMKP